MKRFYILLAAVSLAIASPARSATQDELYVRFYQMIQQADTLIGRKQEKAAVDLYRDARGGLQKLQKDSPGWNKQIVQFRLDYIAGKLGPLENKYPVAKPAPKPAPKKKAAAPVVETQLSSINDELIKERMKSADLRNKLQEALAAKPAEIDPAAHAKAMADLAAAQEKAGSLDEELAALKKKAEDMIEAAEARQLKKAMADSERLAGKQAKDLEALKADHAKLTAELENLDKTELPRLRSENNALQKQIADLGKQAGKTDKAEKALQQISAQNKLIARELEAARDKLADSQRQLARSVEKAALDKAQKALAEKTEELAGKDASLVKMQREIDALEVRVKNGGESARAANYREENSALKKQVSDLSKQIAAAEKAASEIAELKADNDKLEAQLEAARKRSDAASRNLGKMVAKADLEKAQDALENANKELRSRATDLGKARREIADLEKQLKAADTSKRSSDLRKENDALKQRISSMTKAAGEATDLAKQAGALRAENKKLETALKAAQDAADAAKRQLSQSVAKSDLDKAQDAAEAATKARDKAVAALTKAQQEIVELDKKFKAADSSRRSSDLRKENDALKQRISSMTKAAGEATDLAKQAGALRAENKKLETALKAAQDAADAAKRQLSQSVAKSDLDKAQDAAEAATKARDKAVAALTKAQQEIVELDKKFKAADSSRRSSDLRKENAALKKQVSSLGKLAKEGEKVPGLQAEIDRFEKAVQEQAAALKRLQAANQKLTELLNDPKVNREK